MNEASDVGEFLSHQSGFCWVMPPYSYFLSALWPIVIDADVPLYSTASLWGAFSCVQTHAQALPPQVKALLAQGHLCPHLAPTLLFVAPTMSSPPSLGRGLSSAWDSRGSRSVLWGSVMQNFLRQGSKATCCSHKSRWGHDCHIRNR